MSQLILPRRSFLTGLGAIFAAPAIVKADALMRVGNIDHLLYPVRGLIIYEIQTDRLMVRIDRANVKLHIPAVGRGVEYVMNDKEIKTLVSKELLAEIIPDRPQQQKGLSFHFSPPEWRAKGLLPPSPPPHIDVA